MATFLNMVTEIAKDLAASSNNLLDSEIRKAINHAIADFEKKRLPFNEGEATLSTVINDPEYDWPAAVLIVDDVTYLSSSNATPYKLKRITHSEWLGYRQQDTQASRLVSRYALRGRKIFLHPAPDEVTTLTFIGIMREENVPLTLDAQTNAWTEEAELLIKARTKAMIYADRLHHADEAELQDKIAQYRLGLLTGDTAAAQTLGHTSPESDF